MHKHKETDEVAIVTTDRAGKIVSTIIQCVRCGATRLPGEPWESASADNREA